MSHRLALVVDDSRTARITLKRMLETHNLRVDTVASAQQALDYLVNNTPAVIFMDHMMPGMDGLQAVQAIKSNPATASIPIMMYTSKEGDLYISQARALGAIGILPKQVEPAELYKVLNNLGLIEERRSSSTAGKSRVVMMHDLPEAHADNDAPDTTPDDSEDLEDIEEIAREAAVAANHLHETHNHLGEVLESHRQEMAQEIRELREAVGQLVNTGRHRNSRVAAPLLVAFIMLIPLLWLAYSNNHARNALNDASHRLSLLESTQLYQQEQASADNSENVQLRKQLDANRQQADTQSEQLFNSITWAINQSSPYDIREEAYSDRRLAIIQELVSRLSALGFHGVVQLDSHLGKFCLGGNDVDGYTLPPADMPVTECNLIGHPLQQLPSLGSRQSIAFANFLATSPLLDSGNISLELIPHLYSRPLADYPPQHADVSAYEWNRVAARNNRVEVTLIPAEKK